VGFIGLVRIAQSKDNRPTFLLIEYLHHRHHLILISSIYPIRGGGDYRGIYDIGFKRGFMGYIGLLLNAPYKIDSMVWMSLM
jgi:hypothetical protein